MLMTSFIVVASRGGGDLGAQRGEAAMDERTDGGRATLEDAGDLVVGQVAQVAQHDGRTLSNRERLQRVAELGQAGVELGVCRRVWPRRADEAAMQRSALVDDRDTQVRGR